MITPRKLTHTIENTTPLPPGWLRLNPTTPLDDQQPASGLYCAGPGKELQRRLIVTLDQAREVVLIASFLLADQELTDALLRAVERGVRVYALNSSEQRLSRATESDGDFDQRMIAEHKELLNRLAGKVLLRSAEHFHAKFLVIDPRGETRGWISTANFNRALVDSVELGVELTAEEARALAARFNRAFWCEAERELVERGSLPAVGEPPAEPPAPVEELIPSTAKDCTKLQQVVYDLIAGATHELFVCSFGFDENHPVVLALAQAARRGVQTTVLTRPRPTCKAAIQLLHEAGATVVAHDKLHAKAVWADGRGLVMTANLAAQGLDQGFEVGVELAGVRAEGLRHILKDWTARFPWRFEVGASINGAATQFCPLESPLKDGVQTIQEERIEKLPPIEARDALNLDDAKRPDFARIQAGKGQVLARRIRVEWEVRPPRMPTNAKEKKQERTSIKLGKDGKPVESKEMISYEPPVYQAGNESFVLLQREEDREAARKLADQLKARVVVK
jgi:cardiolipin synthase A/B